MASIQDLREQRADLARQIQAVLDRPNYNRKDQDEADALFKQVDVIDDKIVAMERSVSLSAYLNGPIGSAGDGGARRGEPQAPQAAAARKAFASALRYGLDRLDPEERLLIDAGAPGNRGRVSNIAEGTNTAGGYMVPTLVMPTVLKKLKAYGGMRSVARILSTDGGAPLAWATNDDTAATGELVAENVSATAGDMTFGLATLGAYKFSSKIVPVSFEVLQDAAVDVEEVVTDALATRLARAQNTYFTIGTGTAQPYGVVNQAALGYTMPTGNTTTITYDSLVNLYHSVDPTYRASPSASFMMNDTTFKAIKLLKDSSGRPIWLPGGTAGGFEGDAQFDTLLGKRLVINQDMVPPAANAKTILFGDFSKYMIRDVMNLMILRFSDSAYTSKGQIGFLAWARADGRMIDASNESIRYLVQSAS